MIMCIDADCEGGETILHLNDHFKYASNATTIPKHCLIFRKDINHEGALIKKGYKEIMTLNLWGVKDEISGIVIISFDDDERTYILSIDAINSFSDSVLRRFIHFYEESKKKVFRYHDKLFMYEDLRVIDDLYNGKVISYKDIVEYKHVIDYYGFDWRNMLVKKMNVVPLDNIIEEMKNTNTNELVTFGDGNNIIMKNDNDTELLTFGDEKQYKDFLSCVKDNKLPYIPFKIILVEGKISFGGGWCDRDPVSFPITPVWVSVSERNNIVLINNLVSPDACNNTTLKKMKPFEDTLFDEFPEYREVFENLVDGEKFVIVGGELLYDVRDDLENELGPGKFIPYGEYISMDGVRIDVNLSGCMDYSNPTEVIKTLCDPRADFTFTRCLGTKVEEEYDNYIIDTDGKLAIRPSDYQKILDKIYELDLYKTVISRLNIIQFILCQKFNESLDHFFCNEEMYGNFNFIMVYGFFKI